MTDNRFQRIDEIFRAALHEPEASRHDFVRAQAGGDDSLASEVLRRLEEDAAALGALDKPALGGPLDLEELVGAAGQPAALPERIGRYRVIRCIGRGGMGIVYQARHRSESFATRQGGDVALKVLHAHYASRADIVERFEREAELGIKLDKALKEAHRVLKFGGRFFCLEFSTTTWPGFSDVYDAYSHRLVPQLGKLFANDADSYRYLIESIRRFPPMPKFEVLIRDAGFTATKVEPILGGLVAIHSGWKI